MGFWGFGVLGFSMGKRPDFDITVQNSGKWLTWNICTGGMGNAGYKGNMEYLH